MISRKTAHALAEVFEAAFGHYGHNVYIVEHNELYDFLYSHDFPAWFCNMAKPLRLRRAIQEWVMKLHTGESLVPATQKWSWEDRAKLGQEFLERLAECLPARLSTSTRFEYGQLLEKKTALNRLLELDGYRWSSGSLQRPELDAVDAKEAVGVLEQLLKDLAIPESPVALHHLALSEEHYIEARWDDSISNSRKFLEATLQGVAQRHHQFSLGTSLPVATRDSPAGVRDYLDHANLLEKQEREALAKVYGLLSHTGGHPYMAQNEQARLLRHLSLTFSQFVLLRLRGALEAGNVP